MSRTFLLFAALLGFTGVAIGAFGAHGLETTLETNNRVDTFETATQYHLYHALALLGVAWLSTRVDSRFIWWAGCAIFVGTLIFSGSLYILAVFDIGFMGATAPIGGTLLLIGWACMGFGVWYAKELR